MHMLLVVMLFRLWHDFVGLSWIFCPYINATDSRVSLQEHSCLPVVVRPVDLFGFSVSQSAWSAKQFLFFVWSACLPMFQLE